MILDKALILKGLGGLTALGGSAAAVCFVVFNNDSPESLIEKAGLKCTFAEDSCEITSLENGKKINVKHGNNTKQEDVASISPSNGGKIKVQKNVAASEGYNKNLKLTIKGGDINLTGGTASGSGSTTITKLEQFETYEIVKEGDKYYLSWKRTAIDEKSKALGLPDNCKLPSSETTTCENITQEQLKAIKFDGKGDGDVTIENNGTPSITLTITKTNDNTTYPNGGYKFAFQSNKDITISSASPAKYIKKNTNTEFKIKETTAEGGAKTLSLEKAWTVTSLGAKVGLNCPDPSNEKKCTFTTENKINVKNDNDKIEGAKLKNSSDASSKKMTYEEDKENYNQGFKFYVEEDITLTKDTEGAASTEDKTINKKTNDNGVWYEIKEEGGKWYLAKKETTNG